MKKDWTYKKLGEVCEKCKNIHWEEFDETKSFSYIDLSSVNRESLSIKDPQTITKTNAPSRAKQIVKEGDIIFATTRPTLRRVCMIPASFDGQVCSTGFSLLRPKKEVLSEWIFYILQSEDFYRYIEPLQTGANYPAVTDSVVKKYRICIPPLSEQSRIVSRLDAAFGEIEGLKAKAEAQLREARALFQAALAKEMKPKQGWEEKKLKEIGTTQTGTTPSKNDKDNYGDFIPFIRPSEIDYDGCGGLKYDSEIKLSEKGLSNGRLFKAGSILMVCIGATISKVGVTSEDVSCNQQINVLKPKQEYDSKFIYYAMRNEDFKQKVIKEGTSSQATLPIINKGKWENLSLSLPPLPVQQSIVSRLDALSEKVRELEETQKKVIAECDALKQALLREVFE